MDTKNEVVHKLRSLRTLKVEDEKFSRGVIDLVSELDGASSSKAKKQSPPADINLLCEFMSPSENDLLWEVLLQHSDHAIGKLLDVQQEEEDLANPGKEQRLSEQVVAVASLFKVAALATRYFDQSNLKPRPSSFLLVLQTLHNILVPLDESIEGTKELKSTTARLCEKAWHQEEDNCEQLLTQLIPYLLLNVLDSCNTKDVDVKRLYAIRNAFTLLDYEDESIQTIQGLLLRCFADPSFLKVAEGRKFLSFTFTLHSDLHNLIVGVMKPQLGTGNKSVSQSYGDILYRAWRDVYACTNNLESSMSKIELNNISENGSNIQHILVSIEDNLQDMAHNAIHARERKYFKSLCIVLNAFHENKNAKGVDALLLKIYGPIIWRSLRCANPLVRMQAAVIFFDCFPLQSPSASTIETENLLQKQFDLLNTLLKDSDQRVRAASAFGVCKILRVFWEVIPTGSTRQILTYVVGTLGVDASCASVRANVIEGMSELLENPLSHVVLKGLLPMLANSVHDYSERVRASFLRLLCKLKTTRGFTFYDIVSIDKLCDQLTADVHHPAICSIMTELLLNSFYPRAPNVDSSAQCHKSSADYGVEQIKRCLQFVRSHREAAIVFYSNLHLHASVGSSAKLCVGLWNTLRDNMRKVPSSTDVFAIIEHMRTLKESGKNRKRSHPDEWQETLRMFEESTILCEQILSILLALLNSVHKMISSSKAYNLSRDLLLNHFTPSSVNSFLEQILDMNDAAVEVEDMEMKPGIKVLHLAQSSMSMLVQAVAVVSTLSCDSKSPRESPDVFFTAEEMLSLYIVSLEKRDDPSMEYAESILDAAISLDKASSAPRGKNSKKNKKSAPLPHFSLWNLLTDSFEGLYSILSQDETRSNLGKRKNKNKRASLDSEESYNEKRTALIKNFPKTVTLFHAFLEGKKKSIVDAREVTLRNPEAQEKVWHYFGLIRLAVEKLLTHQSECSGADFDEFQDVKKSLILCVRLWTSISCRSSAVEEDSQHDSISGIDIKSVMDWISAVLLKSSSRGMVSGGTQTPKADQHITCPRFRDELFASEVDMLTDALMCGVCPDAVADMLLTWVRSSSGDETLVHSAAAFARLALAIHTGRMKGLHGSLVLNDNDRIKFQNEALVFEDKMDVLWEYCIDIVQCFLKRHHFGMSQEKKSTSDETALVRKACAVNHNILVSMLQVSASHRASKHESFTRKLVEKILLSACRNGSVEQDKANSFFQSQSASPDFDFANVITFDSENAAIFSLLSSLLKKCVTHARVAIIALNWLKASFLGAIRGKSGDEAFDPLLLASLLKYLMRYCLVTTKAETQSWKDVERVFSSIMNALEKVADVDKENDSLDRQVVCSEKAASRAILLLKS